jgi:diguanylate cyclase (GGDEF)-like protein
MDAVKPPTRRWRLRFEPELEREYLAGQAESARRWVRMSTLVALSTVLGFAVIDHYVLGYRSEVPNIVRFGLQLPLVLIALGFTTRKLYARWYQPAIQISAPLFGLGIVVMAAYAAPEQVPLVGARLLLVTFFCYFMLALPFGAALRCNLIVTAGYFAATLLDVLPSAAAIYQLFALICANLIGASGCYVLEYANRQAFLERRRLQEVAARDGLTGLFNRAAFEERIHQLWRQATRDSQPISVIMIDIDHFKAYNDQYGHQAGDACLRKVSRTIDAAAIRRPFDFVARYGGEELVAVLFGADRVHAEDVAKGVLMAVNQLAIEHVACQHAPHVTVSMGVATYTPPLEASHDRAVKLADRALYLAKRQGRDRYVAVDIRLTTDASFPTGPEERRQVSA